MKKHIITIKMHLKNMLVCAENYKHAADKIILCVSTKIGKRLSVISLGLTIMFAGVFAGCVHRIATPVPAANLEPEYNTASSELCSSSGKQCAETYFMISDLKLHEGNIDGAINELKRAVKYDPSSPYLYLLLARLHAQKQLYKQALDYDNEALKIDNTYLPALYTKAEILMNMNQNREAIDILKQIVKLSPDSEDAYITLALTLYHTNNTAEAKDTLKEMSKHIPSSPYPYYYLAKISVDEKNYKEAINYYDKALKTAPDFYTALYEEADVYAYLKDYNRAIGIYQSILSKNPDEYGLYEKIGDLYLTAKKYVDALNSYKKAEVYIPSLVLQLKIGMTYVELKQYNEAEHIFKSIIDANPSFYRAYYYYGLLLAENNKYDKAIEILKRIPENDDMYQSAIEEIAIIYSQQKNNKEAENVLLPIVEKYPAVEHYNLFASFFAEDKDYKSAIEILNKALNKFTDSQSLLYHLGIVYDQAGEQENAMSVMEQILKINPDNADALNYIGYTYADKGIKLDKAEKFIKKALQIKPNDGYITDSLGWVYYKKGLIKKAIVTLKQAAKLSNNDPQILEHLGDAYLKAGDKHSAVMTFKTAINSKQLTDDKLKRKLEKKLQKLGAK